MQKITTHITEAMQQLIENYSVGAVATVNDDGTPAVSPKATFVIVDKQCIAFGHIRSPGTVANITARPDVEVNFIDVLTRRAVRIKGLAKVVEKNSEAGRQLSPVFEPNWAPYMDAVKCFVVIDITHAEMILSPAYDLGLTASELKKINLEKLSKLGD